MKFFCQGVLSGVLVFGVASASERGQENHSIAELDQPPQNGIYIAPEYPVQMRILGDEGFVVVEFVIGKTGKVTSSHVASSSNPWLERAALNAVNQWFFKPGRVRGTPVDVRAQQKLDFAIEDRDLANRRWRVQKSPDHPALPEEFQWEKPPVAERMGYPVFPLEALLAGVSGATKINFVIGKTGTVDSTEIVEATTTEMGMAAAALLEFCRFSPPQKADGTPCLAMVTMEHRFDASGLGEVPVMPAARKILRVLRENPEQIATEPELDAPPTPLLRPAPVFPTALRKTETSGEATIELFIDTAGDAQLPRIVSATAPEFGYAAAQAVAAWRFTPPLVKGKPAIVRVQIPVGFSLQETAKPAAN